MKWAPTSADCSPIRILFLRTPEAKERLKPALGPRNVEKTMTAPVTAIVAYDLRFYEKMPPENRLRDVFASAPPEAQAITAFRNGSIQGGYFILAARAVGLDCGPMSGFDNAKVDAEFFAPPLDHIKSNFLCGFRTSQRLPSSISIWTFGFRRMPATAGYCPISLRYPGLISTMVKCATPAQLAMT